MFFSTFKSSSPYLSFQCVREPQEKLLRFSDAEFDCEHPKPGGATVSSFLRMVGPTGDAPCLVAQEKSGKGCHPMSVLTCESRDTVKNSEGPHPRPSSTDWVR